MADQLTLCLTYGTPLGMKEDPHGLLGDSVPLPEPIRPIKPVGKKTEWPKTEWPAQKTGRPAQKTEWPGLIVIYSHTAAKSGYPVHLYLTKGGMEVPGTFVGNPDSYFFADKQVSGEFDRLIAYDQTKYERDRVVKLLDP